MRNEERKTKEIEMTPASYTTEMKLDRTLQDDNLSILSDKHILKIADKTLETLGGNCMTTKEIFIVASTLLITVIDHNFNYTTSLTKTGRIKKDTTFIAR